MQDHFADILACCGSAGLAGGDYGKAAGTKSSRQLRDLRALAATVEALERDEFSTYRHVGNDSRHAARVLTSQARQFTQRTSI